MHVRIANITSSKRLFAVAAVATLALAACGDDDDASRSSTTAAAAPPTTVAPAATDAVRPRPATATTPAATDAPLHAPATAAGLLLADTGLGQVVTAADGMTRLHVHARQRRRPDLHRRLRPAGRRCSSTTAPRPPAGDGIDAAMLATATHPEGGTQVTYNGWPLYYFAGDSAPGDTNGQGQGDVWYVIDAAASGRNADRRRLIPAGHGRDIARPVVSRGLTTGRVDAFGPAHTRRR